MNNEKLTRASIETQLIQRASQDPAFRDRLIADPRATISEACGASLPDSVKITVFEETPNRLCLVLPLRADPELSDADLVDVSGGVDSKTYHPGWKLREDLRKH